MTKRQPPETVTNHDVRVYLSELATHIETLEKHRETLLSLARDQSLTDDQRDLLKQIISARNNLDAQWKQLTPSIQEAIVTGRFIITNK